MDVTRPRREHWRPSPAFIESAVIFVVFLAAYFAIGYRVVVDLHVVNYDALSRMAHAFFVWHNDPAKLAAIGFVWPPIQTLAFLPFTLIKPLATSLTALPATSAAFAAGMLVALNAVFRLVEMRPWARWSLLVAFGINPMVVYYAANGMAESVYLFFLVTGVYFLLRWHLGGGAHLLALVGTFFGLAALSRWEMAPYALLVGLALGLILYVRKADAREVEGSVLLYLAPIAYLAASWLFFSWLIVGDPFHFLEFGPASADLSASQGQLTEVSLRGLPTATIAEYLLLLNLVLFPLAVIVAPSLFASALAKRDLMSLVLALLVITNAAVTAFLFWRNHDSNLFQLRYNMRAMPLAMIGAAWLFWVWRASRARHVIWGATLLILVASLPLTWQTMQTYTYQYEENVFLTALASGEDQEGNIAIGGYPIGIRSERDMADHITDELPRETQILTDDAQSLGVMLLTGSPDRFIDRIDDGDDDFKEIRDAPFGKVDYFLVATDERCRPPCEDLVRTRYPGVLADREPGMRVVYSTPRYALIELDRTAP
jgi:hypothetical protein